MTPEQVTTPAPQRKHLAHAMPAWVGSDAIFFITLCCAQRGTNQLCSAEMAAALFESASFRTARGDWYIHLLLLMPDHCHALISFPRDREMKKVIANWKEITAKRTGVRWQRDFFDHRLRAEESFEEKAQYVRMNPVRKGLVSKPDDWIFRWEPKISGHSGIVPPS
jgi:REP element-mobilizing transposase RayT